MPIRWMVNESAPRSDTMASDTAAFTPVISATTVMIDDTATILPSSVSIDRSLLAQIDASASIDGFEESAPFRYSVELVYHPAIPMLLYLVRRPGFGATVFTTSPSYIPRTESNGPVITRSPSLSPATPRGSARRQCRA